MRLLKRTLLRKNLKRKLMKKAVKKTKEKRSLYLKKRLNLRVLKKNYPRKRNSMLLVRCPKCNNTMKYQPNPGDTHKKTKTCVYCGRSFRVVPKSKSNRIVKILKKGE